MKKLGLILVLMAVILTILACFSVTAFAEDGTTDSVVEAIEEADSSVVGSKAIAAAIVVGISSALGAVGMGIAIAKSAESMARQPEAAGKINGAMMLGLVFIETLIIYALIVAILIIFVL